MTQTTDNSIDRPGASILVVDDHATVRESIAATLTMFGHQVASAASAKEALQRSPQQPLDVVVTDLQMPAR